jgi:IclR family transcriptional regulator, acetate operon repressor
MTDGNLPDSGFTLPVEAPSEAPSPRRRGRPAQVGAPEAAGVQSLTRALDLLEVVAVSDRGIGLTELAKATELAPSTAHRLLKSLQQRRFVHHDAERSLWFIGVQAFSIGAAFLRTRNVVAAARPVMRWLMETSGESVNLAVLDEAEAVYLAQIECQAMMRALARPGGRAPLHCSGVGKALLAALPQAQLAPLVARIPFTRYTEHTIADGAKLRAALVEARAQGYAVDNEEFALGLRCVAAPITDEHGEAIAAISCSGPSARITDARLCELGGLTASAARQVTAELGGTASPAAQHHRPD